MPFNIGGEIYDSGSLATYGRNQLIQDGLVFHLDAAYANSFPKGGVAWYDLASGSSAFGILSNGPIYSPLEGGYVAFDGVNDGVSIADTTALSLNEMTISSWNYSSNYFQDGFLFEKTTNGTVNTQYSLFFQDGNDIIIFRTYGLSNQDLSVGPIDEYVSNNSWNNVVATYDGSVKKIYVNGELAAAVSASGTVTQNTTGAAYIGAYGSLAGYWFNGSISNTMLYNRALSADEVLQNYNTLKGRYGYVDPVYETLTFTTSSTITLTGNGTTSVDISKTGGSSAWGDAQAYSSQAFTAPCTIEYEVANNSNVRLMVSWNTDPVRNADYNTLDWAAYHVLTTEFNIYHNGTRLLDAEVWDDAYKMYAVYDTDGYIRYYNGTRLIYSVFKGFGGVVYVDTAFRDVSTSNKITNLRVVKNAWDGVGYKKSYLPTGSNLVLNPVYENLTFTASSTITITGNGTNLVSIAKTSGTSAWDSHAYTAQGFTAPCTIEVDVANVYPYRKMISWNADPTTDASYASLDWAAYPGATSATEYLVYHNATQTLSGETWDDAYKLYIVYDTDGYIKHYNGGRLLYSAFKGTGGTVYVDTSFYEASSTNRFENVRVTNNAWRGDNYYSS